MSDASILVINTGSSSLKFGVYASHNGEEQLQLDGAVDGIGREGGKLELKDGAGETLRSEAMHLPSQGEALHVAIDWLAAAGMNRPAAIGHRVVHGGPQLVTHQRITPEVVDQLRACIHFAPLHIPMALDLIEKAGQAFPGLPQFACFDTAFHRTLPEIASWFALPAQLFTDGIRRYGFHGLSYESIVYQLGRDLPSRTVIAHLGGGSSLAAVQDGKSVDTSMGLTPTGGIPMTTRSGDLDPGVLLYLLRVQGKSSDELEDLLNHRSGLAAISGASGDMRELESAAGSGDQRAGLAIDIFSNAIRKTVAAYTAVLGSLDLLVFAGGIGEHSARIRADVCGGLGFLGISLDTAANGAHKQVISQAQSRVTVRIVPSQEDLQIARHSRALLLESRA